VGRSNAAARGAEGFSDLIGVAIRRGDR
jgi:hypothetical protein